MSEERRSGAGWTFALIALAVGVFVGAGLTLGLLGLDLGYLLGRVSGSAPALVPATAVPTPVAAIQGGFAPGSRLVWEPPIPLDSDTRDPDLLVISRNHDRGADTLLYFSPDAQAVRWESPPLGDNGTSWVVAYDEDRVYLADEARLMAMGRADGAPLWEAPLTDAIFDALCQRCLQVAQGAVVALTDDGVLQAFNAATGAPRWSVRLRETPRQLIIAGGRAAVPDISPDERREIGLYFYSLADGSPAGQIEPSCVSESTGWVETPYSYDPIFVDPGGRYAHWMIESSPYCLVRADLSSGAVAWQVMMDRQFSAPNLAHHHVIFAGDTLYLSDGGQIAAVSGAGAARTLIASEDYEIYPLAANSDSLLVHARRSRGSTRDELWLVEAGGGQKRWERVLAATDSTHEDNNGDWAATIVDGGVALLEQTEEPEQISYELIGLGDGASRARAVVPAEDGGSTLRGVTWGPRTLFLAADELYAVDLAGGETRYHWP